MSATATVIPFPASDDSIWTSEVETFLLAMRARRASPNTIVSYRAALETFRLSQRARQRSTDPEQLTRRDVELYLIEQAETGMRPSTQMQRFAVLRAFFNHLLSEQVLDRSPMERMKPPKFRPEPVPLVGVEQIDALLASASGRSFIDRRDAAIIRLMLSTGIRRSEALAIDLDNDLNIGAGEVTIHGKGETVRTVRFGDATALALTRYLRERAKHRDADLIETIGDRPDTRREGRPLFLGNARTGRGGLSGPGLHAMLKRRCRAAGIDAIHLHQFRHTWTDAMLSSGHNEQDVVHLGGWTSGKMLGRYGAAAQGQRARRNYRDPMDRILRKS